MTMQLEIDQHVIKGMLDNGSIANQTAGSWCDNKEFPHTKIWEVEQARHV